MISHISPNFEIDDVIWWHHSSFNTIKLYTVFPVVHSFNLGSRHFDIAVCEYLKMVYFPFFFFFLSFFAVIPPFFTVFFISKLRVNLSWKSNIPNWSLGNWKMERIMNNDIDYDNSYDVTIWRHEFRKCRQCFRSDILSAY